MDMVERMANRHEWGCMAVAGRQVWLVRRCGQYYLAIVSLIVFRGTEHASLMVFQG